MPIDDIRVFDTRAGEDCINYAAFRALPLEERLELHKKLSRKILSSYVEGGITFEDFLYGADGYLNQHGGVMVINGRVIMTYKSFYDLPLDEEVDLTGSLTNSIPFVYSAPITIESG